MKRFVNCASPIGSIVPTVAQRRSRSRDTIPRNRRDKNTGLNMDSGQFAWLRHQQLQKGFEQAFTPDPDVVHELKEAQVERQFFL